MRLLIQPDDGVQPLVKAIAGARHRIEIVIFRMDDREIERALTDAVGRGVSVQALIAHTNRTGEEPLRKLELRLLGAGVTVARTDNDLTRYHGKLMIVDRRELYLLAFNLTYSDIEHCRSFGIATKKPEYLREAVRLFEADSARRPYEAGSNSLIVSPVNARSRLAQFLAGARKELVIYDPKVSDLAMVRILEERVAAGVQIRLIGRLTRSVPGIAVCKMSGLRVHTRTIVRDSREAFVGSQSLRAVELDARREVGLIFREPKTVRRIHETFASDWAAASQSVERAEDRAPNTRVAKKVAKRLAKELPQVAPVLNGAVKEVAGAADIQLDPETVEAAVKDAVKSAVKEVVSNLVEEAVADGGQAR